MATLDLCVGRQYYAGPPIAAVPWEDSFALFITNPQGSVYTIKAAPGYGWQLVPGLTSKPGAPITALASGGRFVLFSTDASGEVFTTSGIPLPRVAALLDLCVGRQYYAGGAGCSGTLGR